MSIVWQDNVTPLNAANMNTLEQVVRKGAANGYASLDAGTKVPLAQLPDLSATYQLAAQKAQANGYASLDGTGKVPAAQLPPVVADATKVDKDSIVVAATRIVANKLLAGDAQPVFQILGDGTIGWGLGGANAIDTTLKRNAAGSVISNGSLYATTVVVAQQGTANQVVLGLSNAAPASGISFGNGVGDTNLYRASAGQLQTDGGLTLGQNLFLPAGVGAIVARLRTAAAPNVFVVSMAGDTADRLSINRDGSLNWSMGNSAPDFALVKDQPGYITAPSGGMLFKDPSAGAGFIFARVGSEANWRFMITTDGIHRWGPGGSTAIGDNSLYRLAANTLGIDGGVSIDRSGVGYGLAFGASSDAYIYRDANASLISNGTFNAKAITGKRNAPSGLAISGGGFTILNWTGSPVLNGGVTAPDGVRIGVPKAGIYYVWFKGMWNDSGGGTAREVYICSDSLGTGTRIVDVLIGGNPVTHEVFGGSVVSLPAGDSIYAQAYNDGGAVTLQRPEMGVMYLGHA